MDQQREMIQFIGTKKSLWIDIDHLQIKKNPHTHIIAMIHRLLSFKIPIILITTDTLKDLKLLIDYFDSNEIIPSSSFFLIANQEGYWKPQDNQLIFHKFHQKIKEKQSITPQTIIDKIPSSWTIEEEQLNASIHIQPSKKENVVLSFNKDSATISTNIREFEQLLNQLIEHKEKEQEKLKKEKRIFKIYWPTFIPPSSTDIEKETVTLSEDDKRQVQEGTRLTLNTKRLLIQIDSLNIVNDPQNQKVSDIINIHNIGISTLMISNLKQEALKDLTLSISSQIISKTPLILICKDGFFILKKDTPDEFYLFKSRPFFSHRTQANQIDSWLYKVLNEEHPYSKETSKILEELNSDLTKDISVYLIPQSEEKDLKKHPGDSVLEQLSILKVNLLAYPEIIKETLIEKEKKRQKSTKEIEMNPQKVQHLLHRKNPPPPTKHFKSPQPPPLPSLQQKEGSLTPEVKKKREVLPSIQNPEKGLDLSYEDPSENPLIQEGTKLTLNAKRLFIQIDNLSCLNQEHSESQKILSDIIDLHNSDISTILISNFYSESYKNFIQNNTFSIQTTTPLILICKDGFYLLKMDNTKKFYPLKSHEKSKIKEWLTISTEVEKLEKTINQVLDNHHDNPSKTLQDLKTDLEEDTTLYVIPYKVKKAPNIGDSTWDNLSIFTASTSIFIKILSQTKLKKQKKNTQNDPKQPLNEKKDQEIIIHAKSPFSEKRKDLPLTDKEPSISPLIKSPTTTPPFSSDPLPQKKITLNEREVFFKINHLQKKIDKIKNPPTIKIKKIIAKDQTRLEEKKDLEEIIKEITEIITELKEDTTNPLFEWGKTTDIFENCFTQALEILFQKSQKHADIFMPLYNQQLINTVYFYCLTHDNFEDLQNNLKKNKLLKEKEVMTILFNYIPKRLETNKTTPQVLILDKKPHQLIWARTSEDHLITTITTVKDTSEKDYNNQDRVWKRHHNLFTSQTVQHCNSYHLRNTPDRLYNTQFEADFKGNFIDSNLISNFSETNLEQYITFLLDYGSKCLQGGSFPSHFQLNDTIQRPDNQYQALLTKSHLEFIPSNNPTNLKESIMSFLKTILQAIYIQSNKSSSEMIETNVLIDSFYYQYPYYYTLIRKITKIINEDHPITQTTILMLLKSFKKSQEQCISPKNNDESTKNQEFLNEIIKNQEEDFGSLLFKNLRSDLEEIPSSRSKKNDLDLIFALEKKVSFIDNIYREFFHTLKKQFSQKTSQEIKKITYSYLSPQVTILLDYTIQLSTLIYNKFPDIFKTELERNLTTLLSLSTLSLNEVQEIISKRIKINDKKHQVSLIGHFINKEHLLREVSFSEPLFCKDTDNNTVMYTPFRGFKNSIITAKKNSKRNKCILYIQKDHLNTYNSRNESSIVSMALRFIEKCLSSHIIPIGFNLDQIINSEQDYFMVTQAEKYQIIEHISEGEKSVEKIFKDIFKQVSIPIGNQQEIKKYLYEKIILTSEEKAHTFPHHRHLSTSPLTQKNPQKNNDKKTQTLFFKKEKEATSSQVHTPIMLQRKAKPKRHHA